MALWNAARCCLLKWFTVCGYKVEIAQTDNDKVCVCVCKERKQSKTEVNWHQSRLDGQARLVQLYLSWGQEEWDSNAGNSCHLEKLKQHANSISYSVTAHIVQLHTGHC